MADLAGEIATHRHTARRAVSFREVWLDLRPECGWKGGRCRLVGETGETEVACGVLSAVSANGAAFPVRVTGGDGERHGPFAAEAIAVAFPPGADCFLLNRRTDGFWEGVTVTVAYHGIAIAGYACDPA